MDPKALKQILEILRENDITEFELEEEGTRLRIRKGGSARTEAAPAPVHAPAAVAPPPPPPAAAAPPAPAPAAAAAAPAEPAADGAALVKSPIVGTFYRAPDPNSPPFVNLGDRVRVGQVICIIEAMKLMNEIEAEVAGEVVKIHHESGQPVQYGEPLFSIRP
jgi:acetyl-CoA carboxylase biotin carboxyl carrier protein